VSVTGRRIVLALVVALVIGAQYVRRRSAHPAPRPAGRRVRGVQLGLLPS